LQLLALLGVLALPLLPAPAAAPGKIDFNRHIRPILSDSCFSCHGPDEKRRMAGLRLDDKESTLRVLTPGKHSASKLFQRINHAEPARRMPPASSERQLTKDQIQLIARWIDEGAEWQTHWSYVPPTRPEPPAAVANKAWVRNPIDQFVLARLEKEGLKPSPEADKATLLRRVSLDLTGLPPTPEQLKAFLADKSPNAYEKLVDKLIESPHYGERMAMQWLDLARYADTHGYHIDSHRDMWPWRDWVINAFNNNMRFDQFALEQLAGDLLDNATREQRLATGFNRNHMINYEGGAIADEYLTEYIIDRVETTSVAFMGMTMGCARCHDHKYDPISQKDFYRFYAFFNNVDEKGLDGREGNAKPFLPLPAPDQETRQKELAAAIETREKALPEKEIEAAIEAWSAQSNLPIGPKGALAHYELDGSFSDVAGGYRHASLVAGTPAFSNGAAGQALSFDGESHVVWGNHGDPAKGFSTAFWFRPGNKLDQGILHRGTGEQGVLLHIEKATVIEPLKNGQRLEVRLMHRWPQDAIAVRTRRYLRFGEYVHVAVAYDGSSKASGVQVYLDGQPVELEVLHDALTGSIATSEPWATGDKAVDRPLKSQIDDLRFYPRPLNAAEARQLAVDATALAILHVLPAAKRPKDQKERLRDYYLTYAAPDTHRQAWAELKEFRKASEQLEKDVVNSMVMDELEKPRDTFILARGDYRNRTEKVTAAVPASLPPLPAGVPANRLGLAKWLIDPSHPLTARVAVNRFWQNYFGSGLVETSEDFGSQGAPPTHPELLDWLATEFTGSGWDVKAMQKRIVLSATYRQTSKATPELIEKDPQNRLLARMARFRLPAETVRDNALAVSGLLHTTIGGRSVFPYQPPGLWEELAYGDAFTAQTYTPSTGKDLYRRSMYTFWKRTVPPAQMATFDAPDREKCVARRARTNTPLQALILLNDPTYLEAARALATRVITEAGANTNNRIRRAFELAASRTPTSAEVKLLANLAATQRKTYQNNPDLAAKLLALGETKPLSAIPATELAAWTTVTSAILNLDEVITKE
jgi:mono/diheme cytochrome c family protein